MRVRCAVAFVLLVVGSNIALGQPAPVITSGGIVSAASLAPGALAPGSLVAVSGNFGIASPVAARIAPLPLSLGGVSLQFDGTLAAPIATIAGRQAVIQVPWELAAQQQAVLTASSAAGTSKGETVTLEPFAPALFSVNGQGSGQGLIYDASNTLVDPANPSFAGSVVTIYATGLGAVANQPQTGEAAPNTPLAETTIRPDVAIGGLPARVITAALAPGTVGEYAVQVEVPQGVAFGHDIPVELRIGGVISNTVTLAVRSAVRAPPPASSTYDYKVAVSDKRLDPPITLLGVGSSVTFTNTTTAPVTLMLSSSGGAGSASSQVMTLAPGGSQSQTFSSPEAIDVTDPATPSRSGALIVETATAAFCTNPAPYPLPWPAPAALVSAPAPSCSTGFQDSAPSPITTMPTRVGNTSIHYSYVTDHLPTGALINVSYVPALVTQDEFADWQAVPPCPCQTLWTNPAGWPLGSIIKTELVHGNQAVDVVPVFRLWGYCSGATPGKVAPFDASIRYDHQQWNFSALTQQQLAPGEFRMALDMCQPPGAPPNSPGIGTVVAIELIRGLPGGLSQSLNGPIDSADLTLRFSINGSVVNELVAGFFASGPVWKSAGTPPDGNARPAYLAAAADARGGRVFANSGEYVTSLPLFVTAGSGVPSSLSLHYSSLETLRYTSMATLANAAEHAPAEVGPGWSYNYGIRLLLRSQPVPSIISSGSSVTVTAVTQVEARGPKGERTVFACDNAGGALAPGSFTSCTYPPGITWLGAGEARLESTTTGFRLWSPGSFNVFTFDRQGRLTRQEDTRYQDALSVTYTGSEQRVTDSGGKLTVLHFNAANRIDRITDPLGQGWKLDYSPSGYLTAVIHEPTDPNDPTGYTWRFSYDTANGLLKQMLEPGCRLTELSFASGTGVDGLPFGTFLKAVTSGGHEVSAARPATGLFALKDADGQTVTYGGPRAFPTYGLPIKDDLGTTYISGDYLPEMVQDRSGMITIYDRTDHVTLNRVRTGSGVFGTPGSTTSSIALTYDFGASGRRRLASVTRSPSPASATGTEITTYRYDAGDRVVEVIASDDDPVNPKHPATRSYDARGRLASMTDAEKRTLGFTYGTAAGMTNLIESEELFDANGASLGNTRFTYDGLGNVKSATDAEGNTTTYDYDALGRLIKQTKPDVMNTRANPPFATGPSAAQWSYDPLDNPVVYRDPNGNDTTIVTDPSRAPTEVAIVDANGVTASWKTDFSGRLLSMTNRLNGTTTFNRVNGRLENVVGPEGEKVIFGHDSAGNINKVIGGDPQKTPAGQIQVTDLVTDDAGQLVTVMASPMQLPGGGNARPTTEFARYGIGPVQSITRAVDAADKQGERYVHDILGQLRETHRHDGLPDPQLSASFYDLFDYDHTGEPLTLTGPRAIWPGTARPPSIADGGAQPPAVNYMGRDATGRVNSIADSARVIWGAAKINRNGDITDMLRPLPGGTQAAELKIAYNTRGEVDAITNAAGRTRDFLYDPAGNLVWSRDAQGCTRQMEWDPTGLLKRVVHDVPGAPGESSRLVEMNYDYDDAGNLTTITGPFAGRPIKQGGTLVGRRAGGGSGGASTAPLLRFAGGAMLRVHTAAPVRSFGYDRSGRQKNYTDKNGRSFNLEYVEGLGAPRVKAVELPAPAQPARNQKVEFIYDGSALVGIVDTTNNKQDDWRFDLRGRATSAMTVTGGNTVARFWPKYEHGGRVPSEIGWHAHGKDLAGHLQSADFLAKLRPDDKGSWEFTEPAGGRTATYRFANGRLETISRGTSTWTYDYELGRFKSVTLPNNFMVKAEYGDGVVGELKSWAVLRPPDAAGKREIEAIWEYNYDSPPQVTVTYTDRTGTQHQTVYGWTIDRAGQAQLAFERVYANPANPAARTRVYAKGVRQNDGGDWDKLDAGDPVKPSLQLSYKPSTNELLSVSDLSTVPPTPRSFQSQDDTGNVKESGSGAQTPTAPRRVYSYDNLRRLTRVVDTANSIDIEYMYLPTGPLARRIDRAAQAETYFADLGFGTLFELDGTLRRTATFVNDLAGNKLARLDEIPGAPEQYYVYDAEGSIVMTVSQWGDVRYQPRWNAFGEPLVDPPPAMVDHYGFAGVYRDPVTRLVMFAADAWYDPEVGRFLQPNGQSGTQSPYQFAGLAPRPRAYMAPISLGPSPPAAMIPAEVAAVAGPEGLRLARQRAAAAAAATSAELRAVPSSPAPVKKYEDLTSEQKLEGALILADMQLTEAERARASGPQLRDPTTPAYVASREFFERARAAETRLEGWKQANEAFEGIVSSLAGIGSMRNSGFRNGLRTMKEEADLLYRARYGLPPPSVLEMWESRTFEETLRVNRRHSTLQMARAPRLPANPTREQVEDYIRRDPAFDHNRELAFAENDGYCAACQTELATVGDHFHPVRHFVDLVMAGHLTPEEARWEANDTSNIFGLCTKCNGEKSDKDAALRPVPGMDLYVPANPVPRLHRKIKRPWGALD